VTDAVHKFSRKQAVENCEIVWKVMLTQNQEVQARYENNL